MSSFSIVHWFVVALVAVLILAPLWKILSQILSEGGRSRAWGLLALLGPFGLIVLLWIALLDRRRVGEK